jgi:hypothetical protein
VLSGTTSIMVRTATGLCWAALANTYVDGILPSLDRLMWDMVSAVPAWRAADLHGRDLNIGAETRLSPPPADH